MSMVLVCTIHSVAIVNSRYYCSLRDVCERQLDTKDSVRWLSQVIN